MEHKIDWRQMSDWAFIFYKETSVFYRYQEVNSVLIDRIYLN